MKTKKVTSPKKLLSFHCSPSGGGHQFCDKSHRKYFPCECECHDATTSPEKYIKGNCPFCDAEHGYSSAWGMSPEGRITMRKDHDRGHPKTTVSISGSSPKSSPEIEKMREELWKDFPDLKHSILAGYDVGTIINWICKLLTSYGDKREKDGREKAYGECRQYIQYRENGKKLPKGFVKKILLNLKK